MKINNLIVDNYFLASILEVSNISNFKISTIGQNKYEYQYFFLPQDMVNEDTNHHNLDTFGILNKKKLLMREPITGDQVSYLYSKNKFIEVNQTKGLNIKTIDSKIFYLYRIENISHKYINSIFTNLKSKNINIVFPTTDSTHIISDDITNLKNYVKKLSSINIDTNSIIEINIPKEMIIKDDDKIINNIIINNNTFLGMTYQISQIFKILSKDINSIIKASENNNNYVNKIFFTFYNFVPNFLSTFIFKFLLRLNKSYKFSNQVLEIDNLYNFDNYFFSNSMDDEVSISNLVKGKFLPKITLLDSNKDLKTLLSSEKNIICSSRLNIKSKSNIIYLKTPLNKKDKGYNINQSSFELLKLDNCYYEVSPSSLIKMVDLNKNLSDKTKISSYKSKYSDQKQRSLDSFDTKTFKPSLPKIRIRLNWPLKAKNQ